MSCSAASKLAADLDAPLVVFTRSGSSAIRVSGTRPGQPIHALTPHIGTARKLALVWGVNADLEPEEPRSFDDILSAADRILDAIRPVNAEEYLQQNRQSGGQ